MLGFAKVDNCCVGKCRAHIIAAVQQPAFSPVCCVDGGGGVGKSGTINQDHDGASAIASCR